jgi:hypothetical protein
MTIFRTFGSHLPVTLVTALIGERCYKVTWWRKTVMNAGDLREWEFIAGTLDEWNAKQDPMFRIDQTCRITGVGAHLDGPRVALSKTGEPVAIEFESLSSTVCFVFPKALRRANGSPSGTSIRCRKAKHA